MSLLIDFAAPISMRRALVAAALCVGAAGGSVGQTLSVLHVKVVLLDPDTGMEPTRRTESHVGRDEIEEVWRALSSHDWLVLYQHQRRESGWRPA